MQEEPAPTGADPLDPAIPRALAGAPAYPRDPSARQGIEQRQTHLSHVFLTQERVYKLHKSVRFEFADFSSRAERDADALREVALNRRLAPEVYLGVAPVRRIEGRIEVGEPSEALSPGALEHCVVMRRLPEGSDGLALLQSGRLDRAMLSAAAQRLARFHRQVWLGRPAPFAPEEWRRRAVEPFVDCFLELERDPHAAQARLLAERTRTAAEALEGGFERRRRAGRGVDGHGDLHLQHLFFVSEREPPLAIDCIAFREDLRRMDAACDVGFLAMDLRYRKAEGLGEHFLQEYASLADDHDLYSVVDFFVAYRAAVRAKVAALAARDPAIPSGQRERALQSMRDHLALARDALEPRPTGRVVVIHGQIGTGKSTVARALAADLDGVVVSSDRVRKAMAGLPPEQGARAAFGEGLYRQERTAEVYAELAERARSVAGSGRVAILDASYARRSQRDRLREALGSLVPHPILLEVVCTPALAQRRLEARSRAGGDPSDAGPELQASFARSYQPPAEWPPSERLRISTEDAWHERLRSIARSIASRPETAAPEA